MTATALHPLLDPDAARFAIFWEDLTVGTGFKTSSRTVTESDIVNFAALTGDHNRIHVDAEYAAASPYGQRIAHGLLIASIMAGLATRTVVNQMLEPALLGLLATRLRYLKPSFIGDTLHVDIEVIDSKPASKADRGIVTFRRNAVNQRGEIVVEVENVMLVRRRAAT